MLLLARGSGAAEGCGGGGRIGRPTGWERHCVWVVDEVVIGRRGRWLVVVVVVVGGGRGRGWMKWRLVVPSVRLLAAAGGVVAGALLVWRFCYVRSGSANSMCWLAMSRMSRVRSDRVSGRICVDVLVVRTTTCSRRTILYVDTRISQPARGKENLHLQEMLKKKKKKRKNRDLMMDGDGDNDDGDDDSASED